MECLLWARFYYYLQFAEMETEAQKGQMTPHHVCIAGTGCSCTATFQSLAWCVRILAQKGRLGRGDCRLASGCLTKHMAKASSVPAVTATAELPRGCQGTASDRGHWATGHCLSHTHPLLQAGITEGLGFKGTDLGKDREEGEPVPTLDEGGSHSRGEGS